MRERTYIHVYRAPNKFRAHPINLYKTNFVFFALIAVPRADTSVLSFGSLFFLGTMSTTSLFYKLIGIYNGHRVYGVPDGGPNPFVKRYMTNFDRVACTIDIIIDASNGKLHAGAGAGTCVSLLHFASCIGAIANKK